MHVPILAYNEQLLQNGNHHDHGIITHEQRGDIGYIIIIMGVAICGMLDIMMCCNPHNSHKR